jgi:hypothetical protein
MYCFLGARKLRFLEQKVNLLEDRMNLQTETLVRNPPIPYATPIQYPPQTVYYPQQDPQNFNRV